MEVRQRPRLSHFAVIFLLSWRAIKRSAIQQVENSIAA
jgi:hypothetical protein